MSDLTSIQNKLITMKNYGHLDEKTEEEIRQALLNKRSYDELNDILEKIENSKKDLLTV